MTRQLIRTLEELDTLPRWSIIIDDHGYAHQRHSSWIRCSKMHGRLRAKFLLENSLPAIVVWDPRIDRSPETGEPVPNRVRVPPHVLQAAYEEYKLRSQVGKHLAGRIDLSTPISDQAAAQLGAINYDSIASVVPLGDFQPNAGHDALIVDEAQDLPLIGNLRLRPEQHPLGEDDTFMAHCTRCGKYMYDSPEKPAADLLCFTCDNEEDPDGIPEG